MSQPLTVTVHCAATRLLRVCCVLCRGFDWEEYAPAVDDNGVIHRVQQLIGMLKQRSTAYRHRHLLVPFGDDFKFRNAELQFSNMGKLVRYIQQHHSELGVWAQFSTLSDYFSAIEKEGQFPSLQGDFMPYADNEQSYWTVSTHACIHCTHRTHRTHLTHLTHHWSSVLRWLTDVVVLSWSCRVCGCVVAG